METDEALAQRAQAGSREAFEELVRRTSRFLYARLYLETGDPHKSEDLVQETFMRAFRWIGRLTDPKGFRTWLVTISQSALIDDYRRANRKKRGAPAKHESEALSQVAAPPEEDPSQQEARERARSVLQSLPEEYRLPLTLRYLEGADYESIGMQLGLNNGALRGRLYRGLQLLRRSLKMEVHDESR
jgi:RNA polymerase sigma-70 factor (ECF subfamily)